MAHTRPGRRVAVAALMLPASVVGVVTASPAEAQAGAAASMVISGDAGDYVTGGRLFAFSAATGDQVRASTRTSGNAVDVFVSTEEVNGFRWSLSLAAPFGQVLAPGQYPGALRPGESDAPGVYLSGSGRGCNRVAGSFAISRLVVDAAGAVQELDATFEQRCDGATAAARGRVRIADEFTELSSTALALAPDRPVEPGARITAEAAVSPPTAAGSVQFSLDGRPSGSPVPVIAGVASTGPTVPVSFPRSVPVGAEFLPANPEIAGSVSPPVTFQVAAITRTTPTLRFAPISPIRENSPGTFRADVEPADAEGAVQLVVDGVPAGEQYRESSFTPGEYDIPFADLPVGTYLLSVRFISFDPRFTDADSPQVEQTVIPDAPPPVNQPPTAVDDAYTTERDTPLVVAAPGLLANDNDPEGLPLTASLVSQAANGNQVTIGRDGSLRYVPPPGFTGVDTIGYQVLDSDPLEPRLSNGAAVRITVTTPAAAPTVAVTGGLCRADGGAATVTLATADADTDPAALSITVTSSNQSLLPDRALAVSGTGADRTLTLAPAASRSGRARITVTVADGARSAVTTLTVVAATGRSGLLIGTPGTDVMLGRTGTDVLLGQTGDDVLCGGSGADHLFGQDGADVLDGQTGNDALFGGAGADSHSGGPGRDVLIGFRRTEGDTTDGT